MAQTNDPTDDDPTDDRTDDGDAAIEGASGERITLDSVTKQFGDLVAVDEVSLEVRPGELLVLLGPSGCGKTTTLRMIAGLETVTDGSVEIGTEDVTQTLPQNRDVSMVFQSYALYPHKTVRGNLAFPLGKTDLDPDEKEQKIEEVAEMLEITDLLGKDPDQLSGGQRQRVAVGRTVIREPRVFLMDEPLSNLDAELRVQTRAQLHSLQRRLGTTSVYVTHDQEEALSIADRVAIMNDGQIEQVGTPEEVYTRPKNEFVAEFLGEPAINFLDVSGGGLFGGEVSLDAIGVDVPRETVRIGVRPEDAFVGDDRPSDADVAVDGSADGGAGADESGSSGGSSGGSKGEGGGRGRGGGLTDPVTFELDVVEPLGHTDEATLERGGRRFAVQSSDVDGEPGDPVEVRFDADEILAFDSDGGRL